MQITFQRMRPIIQQSDQAFSGTYGGVACLDGVSLYALCSREFPHLYLVQEDRVIASCPVTSLTYPTEGAQCFGLVPLAGGRQIGILLVLPTGRAFLEYATVQGSTIFMQKTAAMQLPQMFQELSYEADVAWNLEGAIGDSLPLGPLGTASGLPQDLFPNLPIGPVSLACPPVITASNEHIIIGVNSIQTLSLRYHHTMDYTPKETFKTWVNQLKEIEYTENVWWESNTLTAEVQVSEVCSNSHPCPICGCVATCTCGKKVPMWNPDGSPYLVTRTFDRIKCTTVLQHPAIVSSIVVLNAATGCLEGLHHIGGTAVGTSLTELKTLLITGVTIIDDVVHVALANTTERASREPLTWGTTPLNLASAQAANHPLHDFLLWWDTQHLSYLKSCTPMPPTFLSMPLTTDYIGKFPLYSLITHPRIELPTNTTSFAKHPATAPFNSLISPRGTSIACNQNKMLTVSKDTILEYALCWHVFTTTYKNVVLGEDTDIHVGKVAKSIPKVVTVKITNTSRDTMVQPTLKIIPSFEYPYYMFVSLSADGSSWAPELLLADIPPSMSQVFYVKVECTTSVDDPKPVPITVTYSLVV